VRRGARELLRLGALTWPLSWLLAAPASAHDGPPYALLVDHPLGERKLEVWVDPDIGTGRYWVVFTPAVEGGPLTPPDEVTVFVAPKNGASPEVSGTGQRLDADAMEFLAQVPFNDGGWWTSRILVRDGERVQEVDVDVEATPAGTGLLGLLIYLFPFVAFGLIFLKLALKRRRLAAAARSSVGSLPEPSRSPVDSVT